MSTTPMLDCLPSMPSTAEQKDRLPIPFGCIAKLGMNPARIDISITAARAVARGYFLDYASD